MRRRPGARRRDSTGPRKPWQCSRQARRQRPSASSSSTAVFYSPPAISAAVSFTPPRAISTAAAAEASAAATEASTSEAAAQQPSGHPGRWGPSRFCSRCGQPGHFYSECRTIPSEPLNTCFLAPYTTPQGDPQENYSMISPGDYASSSGGECRQ